MKKYLAIKNEDGVIEKLIKIGYEKRPYANYSL